MNEDKEFNPEISIYSTVRLEAAVQAAGKLPVTRFKLLVTSSETPKRGLLVLSPPYPAHGGNQLSLTYWF